MSDNGRTGSSPERDAQSGYANGGTGKWLVQPKSPARKVQPASPSAADVRGRDGPARGAEAPGLSGKENVSQISLVGDAVQRWEQLTARRPDGPNLGASPSR